MPTVTDTAGAYMAQLLDEAEARDDIAIRLVLADTEIIPKMDHVRPGDTAFSFKGRTILVLDELVMQAMEGKTLDVQDADDGRKIVLC
jgi:hypothetical protein